MDKKKELQLEITAAKIRKHIIEGTYTAASGHPGGSLSCTDILAVIYDKANVKVDDAKWPDRDRVVMSKGHCAPALYGALIEKGFLPQGEMTKLRSADSHLEGHPNMNTVNGVDMSTGSLGQGISAAVGMALAGKLDKKDYNVYTILGDGEIEEGQVWEAMMAAAHYKLDNLIAFLDHNKLQIDGNITDVMSPEPVCDKFRAFGWNVITVDGHNLEEISNAIDSAKENKGQPSIIVAETIKGKGVSFMENQAGWHGVAPNKEQRDMAMDELDKVIEELEAQI